MIKVRFVVAAFASAGLLMGCSSSSTGDASANVSAACQAFEDAGPQTIDTIEPYLDELVNQAEQAAALDNSYQDFADAAVALRESLLNVGEGTDDEIIARQDMMLAASEVISGYCGAG